MMKYYKTLAWTLAIAIVDIIISTLFKCVVQPLFSPLADISKHSSL